MSLCKYDPPNLEGRSTDAVNADGTIKTELMLEVVAETFRKYMEGDQLSEKALNLIEGAIL